MSLVGIGKEVDEVLCVLGNGFLFWSVEFDFEWVVGLVNNWNVE